MKKIRLTLLLCFVAVGVYSQVKPTARGIIKEMLNTIGTMETITYDLDISERIEDKMATAKSRVKLNVHPRKIYIYIPGIGAEVLWLEGKNNGDALVNPNSFPYMNLNLDPNGSLLRSGQHHTINELGFSYFAKIISSYVNKAGKDFDKFFHYNGDTHWNNKACYKIYIENPDFKYFAYTAVKGDNLVSVARKFHVSEYLLREKNNLRDYGNLKEGKQILVPNSYAQKTIIYIDKETFIPIYQKIFDDKGLFESYEYHNVNLNIDIAEEEFTKTYKGYKF